ncbi:MAG: nucleotide exchange factor GrpE [Chitinophagaceae bacterium]|jgi:molecular chaperone GrpE|nr:nucleotide exchange factor GrpE [Chitinophagaceae bacterium]
MEDKDKTDEPNTDNFQQETTLDLNTDENIAGTSHLHENVAENPDSEELRIALQEQKDKFIRLYAEFDNYKRRNARERIELIQTAGKDVISALLEVLDDCDRAEKQLSQSDKLDQIREGVQLVFNKLRNTLQARGLKEMKSIGETFNPDFHEAITEIPVQDPSREGKIVDEVEKGYYLNDKIIRFSKVVVGKSAS